MKLSMEIGKIDSLKTVKGNYCYNFGKKKKKTLLNKNYSQGKKIFKKIQS